MIEDNTKDLVNILGQLADCEENDPARCELFIVEGDLVGESCKRGRDRRTQAILPFSAEKAVANQIFAEKGSLDKMLSHSDIKSLMSALGTGSGKDDFDIEKLRYHKIIFLCDDHTELSLLRILLFTFFPRELPQLLAHKTADGETNSYVYLAQPPLYQVWNKGPYIKDDRELNHYRIRKAAEEMAVKIKKTGKKLKGRDLSLLLEGMLEFYDYYRRLEGKLIDRKLVDLYQSFIQPSPPPFLIKEGKSDTEIKSRIDLLTYVLTMANKDLGLQRFKHLGEMNPEQLWESAMDPEKRSLLQVILP